MKYFRYLSVFFTVLVFFSSCEDEENGADDNGNGADSYSRSGVYVVNNGVWGNNNASLSFISFPDFTIDNDVFSAANGRMLGDVGQDVLVYGSKLYVVVNQSNVIEVVDKLTCESITSIVPLNEAKEPQLPRFMVSQGGKVFVSLYDGHVAMIDTATLKIEKQVAVGPNPEGLAVSNGFLYVANSDGLNWGNGYANGKSVSKISLADFTEVKRIDVAVNPYLVEADAEGNVYVLSKGDYAEIGSSVQKISVTDEVELFAENVSLMRLNNGVLYTLDGSDNGLSCMAYDLKSGVVADSCFLKGEKPANPSSFDIDEANGDLYIGSYVSGVDYTSAGFVFVYGADGALKAKLEAGVGPYAFAFMR